MHACLIFVANKKNPYVNESQCREQIFTLKLLGALVTEMETASRSGGPSLADGSKENCRQKDWKKKFL